MTDPQPDHPVKEEFASVLNVGAALRAAREAQGLTAQEIADRIKFSLRQIEALEQDDAEHLPQGTFLRGFIRSYARVVHLDPEPLLNATRTRTEHHFEVADVQGGGEPLPVATRSEHKSRYLLIGALLVVIALGLFLYYPFPAGIPDPVQEQSAVPVISPTHVASDAVAEAKNADASKVAATQIELATGDTPVAESALAKPDSETVPVRREIPLEQLMKRPIHIVFLDEAWVEIIDVNQEVLISRVTDAGMEKWIGGAGREPYQVTIGKVGAVRLYYKGNEVSLSGFKPDSVARLVLE